ncbi:Tat proofreading chaperone DmsD [Martelella alba]|uniref:Tat proofreading chaperone DmsD n=2 Tax=Martelella alba TaxID=2590451 RepID=A0ABY2SPQ4_9HYPH|nr:Tat proofreading chaperone DmsD [Martelella alba]
MRWQRVALSGRVLGQLLSAPPDAPACQSLLANMLDESWIDEWPYGEPDDLQEIAGLFTAGLADNVAETPQEAYQRLFIGPYALPAPPWGSVYLDKESVLFGESTLALRRWLRENSVSLERQGNEPEDHIGTLLLLAAWLAEQGRTREGDVLLAEHLFPWVFRFLALLETHAAQPLYQGTAALTRLTLTAWRAECPLAVPPLELYF